MIFFRHQFKANPVNPKIFTNPSMGVKKVPRKPTTVPEGFHLSSDKKSQGKDDGNPDDEHFQFHAQPLNKKILEGVVVCEQVFYICYFDSLLHGKNLHVSKLPCFINNNMNLTQR